MNEDEKNKLEKLRWESERKRKRLELTERLKQLLKSDIFEFLSFEESDKIQLQCDDFPSNKWTDSLYFQTELQNKHNIDNIVKCYTDLNRNDSVFIFFMNFSVGLVKVLNTTLKNYWADFIDIDGDEIFCYHPNEKDFICIEKTEDVIVGDENKNRTWIYEVTFSNEQIKNKLI